MGFWGMSKAGKEAQGWSREAGNWNAAQMKKQLGQADQFKNNADPMFQQSGVYWGNQVNGGFTPGQVRQTGREIMPGVDEAIGRARDAQGRIPTAQTTMSQIGTHMGGIADRINQNKATQGDEINSTAGKWFDRTNAANDSIMGNIASTYGGIGKNVSNAYGSANSNLEILRPGSQLEQARVARSFAPTVAAAGGRMRRFGIDPNSPQAQSYIGGAEANRARAMDDAAAAGTAAYVNAKNDLTLGQLGAESSLAREQGGLTRDQFGNYADQMNSADENWLNRKLANNQSAYSDLQNWDQQNIKNDLIERDLGQQDWQNQMAQDAYGFGLQNNQFDRGMDFERGNQAQRNTAAGMLGNMAQAQYGNMFGSLNAARGFGNDASQNYNTTYQREAPNAAWGLKSVLGMAPMAASLIPGVGQFAGPLLGAAMGGGMGGFGMGGGGGFGGYMPSYGGGGFGGFGNYSGGSGFDPSLGIYNGIGMGGSIPYTPQYNTGGFAGDYYDPAWGGML